MSLFDPIRPKVSPAAITRVGRIAEGNAMALMVPIAPAKDTTQSAAPPDA